MAAEDAAIGVELVEDDVTQIFENARPFGVVRQDAGVQHVWIERMMWPRSRMALRASLGVSPS